MDITADFDGINNGFDFNPEKAGFEAIASDGGKSDCEEQNYSQAEHYHDIEVHSHSEDGHSHSEDGHSHGHFHSPEEKKKQLNRISRIIGHLQYVKRMIENDEDCADVLNQISASKSALNGLGKEIINEHISHCIYHAIENGDRTEVEEFQKAIQKFL